MKFLQSIGLLLATTIILVFLSEGVVRYIFRDITTTSNMQSWFGKRWKANNVHRNSYSMRERDFDPVKQPDRFRIAVIGDSFSFGQGLALEQRYSNLLETSLNERGSSAEVLNFAVPGMETTRELEVLQDIVLALEPDAVILQWLPNDFEDPFGGAVPYADTLVSDRAIHRWLFSNSVLYFLLNQQWKNFRISAGKEDSYEDYLRQSIDPSSEDYQQKSAAFTEFVAQTKTRNIPLLVMLLPLLTDDLGGAYTYQDFHQAVLGWCAQLDANCLDMQPVFAGYGAEFDYTALWVNQFDPHPGYEANQKIAETLMPNVTSMLAGSPQ